MKGRRKRKTQGRDCQRNQGKEDYLFFLLKKGYGTQMTADYLRAHLHLVCARQIGLKLQRKMTITR